MILKFSGFLAVAKYMFVQNFVKLSATVHELSCAQRKKNSDENWPSLPLTLKINQREQLIRKAHTPRRGLLLPVQILPKITMFIPYHNTDDQWRKVRLKRPEANILGAPTPTRNVKVIVICPTWEPKPPSWLKPKKAHTFTFAFPLTVTVG